MTFLPEDLPRIAPWRGGGDGTDAIRSFIEREVGASAAIALTTLFWPRFAEVDGAVLLADRFSEAGLRKWKATLGSDVRSIEAVINHVHLWDEFSQKVDPVPESGLLYLAEVLQATWSAALRMQFPGRNFEVSVTSGEEEYGPTISVVSSDG